jgi:DNA-binding MarR family transcriptional regulator
MTSIQVHDYLERLCNVLRVEARTQGAALGLQPIQIEALHYLARCNRFSDTPQALTDFLGSTKGTVSQTLKVLEERGLIGKRQDARDRRVIHVAPTDAGADLVARTLPGPALAQAMADTPRAEQERIAADLAALLRRALAANGRKTFGACHTCRFNRRRGDGHFCALVGEPLDADDIGRICREHTPPETA